MATWSPALASRHAPRGRRLDLEAWAALPEDEDGELVDGFVTQEEVPDPIHGLAVSWLIAWFRIWLADRAFELIGGRFMRCVAATAGVLRDVPGCPGLELDLDRLWSELGRLAANDE